jgi:hypothetical protein
MRAGRIDKRSKRSRRVALVTISGVVVALTTVTAYAALLTTTASNLSVFKPTKLPGCRFPGAQTLTAAQDSYVDQDAPTATNGSNINLFIMSKTTLLGLGGDDNRRTYVQFTLPSLPEACVVTQATLRLFAKSAASGRAIQAFRANAAWVEGTVTWNNQPGGTGTAATSASGTGWRTWTVTAHVQQMYTGPNNGFMMRDATENDGTSGHSQNYHSSEDTLNRPELIITIGNPP